MERVGDLLQAFKDRVEVQESKLERMLKEQKELEERIKELKESIRKDKSAVSSLENIYLK